MSTFALVAVLLWKLRPGSGSFYLHNFCVGNVQTTVHVGKKKISQYDLIYILQCVSCPCANLFYGHKAVLEAYLSYSPRNIFHLCLSE